MCLNCCTSNLHFWPVLAALCPWSHVCDNSHLHCTLGPWSHTRCPVQDLIETQYQISSALKVPFSCWHCYVGHTTGPLSVRRLSGISPAAIWNPKSKWCTWWNIVYPLCALQHPRKLGLPPFLELWFIFYVFASPSRRTGTCSSARSLPSRVPQAPVLCTPESVQYGDRPVVVLPACSLSQTLTGIASWVGLTDRRAYLLGRQRTRAVLPQNRAFRVLFFSLVKFFQNRRKR